MSYDLSGCVFIKNTFKGAFCLFESMRQLLPLCDEFIVMDLGSDDGTLETLKDIEKHNDKIKVVHGEFYEQDASVFASLANDLVGMCNYPHVLYYQADEIWHENLIEMTKRELDSGLRNLAFWRIQLRYNFQDVKWYPHEVHRIAPKDDFNFVIDGMNSDKVFSAKMVSQWGFDQKQNWENEYRDSPAELPTHEMILDVSLVGGFLDNIPDRRRMHLPFWHEGDVMPSDEGGLPIDTWYKQQWVRQDWFKRQSPFDIPEIMKYHLGKRKYELRPSLLGELKGNSGWR